MGCIKIRNNSVYFFQNEDIFVQLHELVKLDWITQPRIGFNYSFTQAQKHSTVMVALS